MVMQPLKVLMVTPEVVPYAKTGGLADMTAALTMGLTRLGHDIRLILPRYVSQDGKTDSYEGFTDWGSLAVPVGSGGLIVNVEEGRLPVQSTAAAVPVFAIRHDPFFARTGLYGERGMDYPDNLDRFSLFCRGALEFARELAETGWVPDILHAHDWQTALCPVYRRAFYGGHAELRKLRTLLTIHNLGFQGIFQSTEYWKTGLSRDLFTPAGLEFYGSLNVLKGGLLFSDFLTTVSPTYAKEIQASEQGFGLEGVLHERQDRLAGVVNGIDIDIWDPASDPHLAQRYSVSDLRGKQACKTALQRDLALPERNVPVIGMVSRLTNQKGLDLVAAIFPDLMALDLQLVLLGTGDPASEALFRSFQQRYTDKVAVRIGFDETLAHRIEAGADLFLMPSRYEPCGLSQLYSLRYGTVPIVRRTGGLIDTVVPYGPQTIRDKQATGFVFDEPTPQALLNAILLALRVYADAAEWRVLMEAGMRTDVSGKRTAEAYVEIYERIMRG